MKTTIKALKVGELFTLKDVADPSSSIVWVRGAYDRTEKTYECYKWDDVNHFSAFKGTRTAFTGFTF